MAKIKPLRQNPIFRALSDRELALFSRIVSEEEYIKGTVLVAENMKSEKFYLIEKGQVAILTGGVDGGQELVLKGGETFGEWSILAPPHLTSVAAKVIEEAQVLVLEREDFDQFSEEEPVIAIKILRGMVQSLWASIRDAENILKESL